MTARYSVGDRMKEVFPHHASFKALWETKWRRPCAAGGIYPFMYGYIGDFQPVVDRIVSENQKEPYDWDAYAAAFFPASERLVEAAQTAEKANEKDKAAEFFLRASALYRIARFPYPFNEKQVEAYSRSKDCFYKGQALLPNPIVSIDLPHLHGLPHEGRTVPVLAMFPSSASVKNPVAVVICINGLDAYRTDNAPYLSAFNSVGIGAVSVDIPGTGDSPADPSDPLSPDRQLDSVLDWCASQPYIDVARVCMWGFSTGGYYALRAAHTHKERLLAVVCQGGACHHMFDKEWLDVVDHLEYPFSLLRALSRKFGFADDVVQFKSEASRFSLLLDGTLDRPCTPLFMANGVDDTIFPIDDMYLVLKRGPSPKTARFIEGRAHMGEPEATPMIFNWVFDMLGMERTQGDVQTAINNLFFKASYEP